MTSNNETASRQNLENPSIRMTETRFYEPARLSTLVKPLFSLKPLDATTLSRSLLSKVLPKSLNGQHCKIYDVRG